MGTIADAPATIIHHYAQRGLSMQPNPPLKLGIRDVRTYSGPRELVTVTLTDGTKERWMHHHGAGWVRR